MAGRVEAARALLEDIGKLDTLRSSCGICGFQLTMSGFGSHRRTYLVPALVQLMLLLKFAANRMSRLDWIIPIICISRPILLTSWLPLSTPIISQEIHIDNYLISNKDTWDRHPGMIRNKSEIGQKYAKRNLCPYLSINLLIYFSIDFPFIY